MQVSYQARSASPAPSHAPAFWLHLLLLWLAGNALRVTILAVPPVLPAIHRDLHLTETEVGALSGLPVLLLSLAAVFGSLLVARLGARRVVLTGLTLLAAAGALRGIGSSSYILFPMTFLMGAGIAISQPSLSSLVRAWLPNRTSLGIAVYSNGSLVGETIAASLTVPLILPLVGGLWQRALFFWSIPVGLTAVALAIFTRHEPRAKDALPVRWWPDWRNATTWRLGLALGCASLAYFGSNAFVPDYLKATHHAALIPLALTALNLSQIPPSILVAVYPHVLVARRWPLALAGFTMALSAVGYCLGGGWVVVFAASMGFATALVFVLSLALPPLLTHPDDVHRLTAAMFTITYLCPFVGSFVGGAIWDFSGVPATAFVAAGGAGLALLFLVRGLELSGAIELGG